jgi:Ca2+-binding RTX toxin-like protein
MPVFARFDLNDANTYALDSAPLSGDQLGIYLNGATSTGGQAVLDGTDDLVKIYNDPLFQMTRGTLEIEFSQSVDADTSVAHTVLSRDSAGTTDGGFRIESLPDGSILITHESTSGTVTYQTDAGFQNPGDDIKISYSWDAGGTGGFVHIDNLTTAASFDDTVPNTLTMDQGSMDQHWMIGAGQTNVDPGSLAGIDAHYNGSVEYFQLSDSIDNTPVDDAPEANPDSAITDEDTSVTISVLDNDTDPNGDPLTVTSAAANHGTVAINADGTVTYTPDADFNGDDTITYTIEDPAGNSATSTVDVTVSPVNDDPVANDDVASTTVDTAVIIPVLANDTDVDGDILSISGTPTSADGTVDVNPDGTITFTPNAGFTGSATINYTITDPSGATDDAVVTVTVGAGAGPDGYVTGTAGDDLIDLGYTGDPDGDRIDNADALLPGDAPQDDVVLAGAGNDTVLALDGNDEVTGDDGNDLIYGGDGDDSLFGGDGSDDVHGDAGDDFIDTRGPDALPDIDYPGYYAADANPLNDLDTVDGGDGNDTIFTGDDADLITGGAGNDSIDAGFDDDTVYGGADNDTIIGSEGNDLIDGGDGDDLIFGGLDLSFPDALNIPDDAGDLRPENNGDSITGGAGNDTIYGQDDNDTIDGGTGADLIYGGVDNDSLRGGAGNDTLYGGQGNDTIDGGAGDDTVNGDEGNDILSGSDGNDAIFGGTGNDTMDGGFQDDSLYGGAGADVLGGDAGNDLLDLGADGSAPDAFGDAAYGGNDRDTFVHVGAGDVVFGGAGGDDFDVLNLRGAGPYRLVDVVTDSDGNGIDGRVEFLDGSGNVTGSSTFTNIEQVVCFTPGTMIATPRGEVAVENLRVGDKVITRDNGLQEIRWLGSKQMGWHEFAAAPHLRPILIKAGSLGDGLPERDMMLSPNHRVLVANDRTSLYFDEHEVLVSAKHLIGGRGVQQVESIGTTYYHIMFDQHEVVLSNGAWTESFQPGDFSLKGLGNAQRNELFELFPELKSDTGIEAYQAARKTLKKHEARLLAR